MQVSPSHNACLQPRGDACTEQARSNITISKTAINCSEGFRMLVPGRKTDSPFVLLECGY